MKLFSSNAAKGFTLVEVVISIALTGLMTGSVVYGYLLATNRAEWTSDSLAAQSAAMEILERSRAAAWEPRGGVDQLTTNNFPEVTATTLGVDVAASLETTIKTVSTTPPLRLVRVDCIWNFRGRIHTNTAVTYRAPDQ